MGVDVTATPKVKPHNKTSPALSMDKLAPGIKGKKVAILAGDGVDSKQVSKLKSVLLEQGGLFEVIAKFPGTIKGSDGKEIAVDRVAANAPSVVFDAVFIPSGSAAAVAELGMAVHFVTEAFVHGKAIAAAGDGEIVLKKAQIISDSASKQPGVVSGTDINAVVDGFTKAMLKRHYDRAIEAMPV